MKLEKQPVLDRKLPRSMIFYLFSIAAKEGGIAVGDRLVCVSFDILYNVLKFGGKKLNLGKLLFVYLKKKSDFFKILSKCAGRTGFFLLLFLELCGIWSFFRMQIVFLFFFCILPVYQKIIWWNIEFFCSVLCRTFTKKIMLKRN